MNKFVITGTILYILCNATLVHGQNECYSCLLASNDCWSCINGVGGGTSCPSVSCTSCTVAGECSGPGVWCLSGDMCISTPLGSTKICDIQIGDIVLSKSNDGINVTEAIIINKYVAEVMSYIVINETLNVTNEHPIYVNKQWVKASDIKIGDQLESQNGDIILVTDLSHVNKGIRVYNIAVNGSNTYYAQGILVHNKPHVPSQ